MEHASSYQTEKKTSVFKRFVNKISALTKRENAPTANDISSPLDKKGMTMGASSGAEKAFDTRNLAIKPYTFEEKQEKIAAWKAQDQKTALKTDNTVLAARPHADQRNSGPYGWQPRSEMKRDTLVIPGDDASRNPRATVVIPNDGIPALSARTNVERPAPGKPSGTQPAPSRSDVQSRIAENKASSVKEKIAILERRSPALDNQNHPRTRHKG